MKLCIFEDEKYDNLFPLTMTRAAFELKCGHTTLLEKVLRNFPKVDVCYFVRDYLVPTLKSRTKAGAINDMDFLKADDFLFLNGRWLLCGEKLTMEGDEEVATCQDSIVYARVKKQTIRKNLSQDFNAFLANIKRDVSSREIKTTLISFPWDLINNNQRAIRDDFKAFKRGGILGKFSSLATVYGEKEDVFVAKTAEVHPFAVLDTTHGPIIIDEGVTVFPFSRIEGPSCIGRGSQIHRGNIREGAAIGPVCRVGGEVEESIVHGFTNKYHTGFLGHSYVGEWVNLGALTTNSDLKNDYSEVEIFVKGKLINSGETKLGCFIGDHTKTSIGCTFNTGTIVGVACYILSGGEPLPKYIPSFCWFLKKGFYKGSFKGVIETEGKVMGRRDVTMTKEYVELLQKLFDLTSEEREKLIRRSRKKRQLE